MQLPTIGRIVHYRLSEDDAAVINRMRDDFRAFLRPLHNDTPAARNHRFEAIQRNESGFIAHVGSDVSEGDVLAAVVVRTFGGTTANLKVLLDGNDDYWATSRNEGETSGTWSWPPRI